ncbi:hypothetical protein KY289_031073 [Solanum tuberosum]|nr:hypothetical protein KY289_031073 [Solanum tuberosum]
MPLPSQDASIAWTFHPHNATLDIVFFGSFISPSGWVGFGINPNSPEMTGTRALIAFPDPNSGQLVLLPYIIDPSVKLQKNPLLSKPLDIHLLASSSTLYGGKMATIHNGATIQIYATLKLVSNKTKNVHFVWNRGIYVQGYSPTIHPTNINDLSSIATIDVLSGAVTARYLRHVESLGPTWFYVHAGVQLSGILLGTIGFAIGIRLGQLSPGRVYGLHRNLGVVNVFQGFEVMGEGRKAKEDKMRREGLIGSGKFSGSSHG